MEQPGYDAPNYTQTPNPLFDDHMKVMGEAELRVVLCAVRQTFGYHKQSNGISLTQFEEMTGLSRQGVIDGITAATNRGIMYQTGRGKRGIGIYALRIVATGQASRPVKPVDQSTQLTRTSQASRPELVKPVDTQKKGNKEKKKESASTSSGRQRNPLFDAIATELFAAKLDDAAAIKRIAGRVGKLTAFLKDRPSAEEISQIARFVRWYQAKFGKVSLPLDEAKFVTHWTAFEQAQDNAAPGIHLNGNGHGIRRKAYYQNAWVEASRLSSDGTLDGTLRPGWMLAEIAVTGEYGGVALNAGERVYHDGSLPLRWQGLE